MSNSADLASPGAQESAGNPSVWHFRLLLAALMAAELTCSLESNMIYVALSPLYEEYGDPVLVNWMLTAFMLTSFASAAVVGRLGDVFGRRRLMITMLVVATAGSLLSALSHDLMVVIIGRALQGATMGILPLSYGLLRQNCDEDQTTRGIALLGAVYVVGSGSGMILGGLIVDLFNWQWIFVVSAGMSVIALVLVLLFVPRVAASASRGAMDVLGLVLFMAAIGAILLALSWPTGIAGDPAFPRVLLIAGIATALVWVRHELRHPVPFIDIRLLLERPILLANLCIFFTAIGPMMHPIIIMPFLQQPIWTGAGLGLPASSVGLLKLPAMGVQFLVLIACGYIATRYSTRVVLIGAGIGLLAGWLVMIVTHDSLLLVGVLYALLLAPGSVVMFAMIPRLIMASVPEQRTSEATGLTQSIRALGQTLSSQLMGFILASSMISDSSITGAFPTDAAYTLAFLAMAVLSLAALLTLLALRRRSGPSVPESIPEGGPH